MEGIEVYKSSYDYLESLKKMLSTDTIMIDFRKLDEKSRNQITLELRKIISTRSSQVYSTIQNASNQMM